MTGEVQPDLQYNGGCSQFLVWRGGSAGYGDGCGVGGGWIDKDPPQPLSGLYPM